jgi:hypothetical protein
VEKNMMRKLFISLNLIGLLLSVTNAATTINNKLDTPVEVIEVKDLGLSDHDESRSVIEVRCRVRPVLQEKLVSFNLTLFITYADGTTISANRRITGDVLSTRFEVPSVKSVGGRAPAFIKKMDARVTAVISKN